MAEARPASGIIFDVKRFSLHDGPGIRTTVFLKGCPLRCRWCQNPESQRYPIEVFYARKKCRGCRACVPACVHGAVEFGDGGRAYRSSRCRHCGACAQACPTGALSLVGQIMTAEQAAQVALRDAPFYASSGGGVTLSGGEPLAQPAFSRALLQRCKEAGVHTALDTTACGRWEDLAALLPYTDLVLLDLKAIDPGRHRQLTGVDNSLILKNARRLAETGVELVVRIPIIPGQNDDAANLKGSARFLASLPRVAKVEILPYNRLAQAKYARLGLDYELASLETQDGRQMAAVEALLRTAGWPLETIWGLGVPGPGQ